MLVCLWLWGFWFVMIVGCFVVFVFGGLGGFRCLVFLFMDEFQWFLVVLRTGEFVCCDAYCWGVSCIFMVLSDFAWGYLFVAMVLFSFLCDA